MRKWVQHIQSDAENLRRWYRVPEEEYVTTVPPRESTCNIDEWYAVHARFKTCVEYTTWARRECIDAVLPVSDVAQTVVDYLPNVTQHISREWIMQLVFARIEGCTCSHTFTYVRVGPNNTRTPRSVVRSIQMHSRPNNETWAMRYGPVRGNNPTSSIWIPFWYSDVSVLPIRIIIGFLSIRHCIKLIQPIGIIKAKHGMSNILYILPHGLSQSLSFRNVNKRDLIWKRDLINFPPGTMYIAPPKL